MKDFWKNWKNKTKVEKNAIEKVIKARKLIIDAVSKNNLVAIYIKGSFVRREMNKNSDIDIVPIVTKNKYEKPVFRVNSSKVYPCIVVPLSIQEFRTNKLFTKPNIKPDTRAKPDRFLKRLKEYKLIYGKALNPKNFPIRSNKQALKDEIKLIEGYLGLYKKGEIKFNPLLKQVFWLTETEQESKGIKVKHSFKGINASVKDKSHIIHDAYRLKKKTKISKKEKEQFIKKLESFKR